MRKYLATFGAAAMLALFSTSAAAVTPLTQATATARIFKPLTIQFQQNLDFGNLVLAGAGSLAAAPTDSAPLLDGCVR